MAGVIRAAIVDEHPLFVVGVRSALVRISEVVVVADGSSAEDACRIALTETPDIILLSMSMSGGGIDAVRKLRRIAPSTRIIVLAASTRTEDVSSALVGGASGYFLKGEGADALREAIATVAHGGYYISGSISIPTLLSSTMAAHREDGGSPVQDLSPRETAVMGFAATGRNNREIALELDTSVYTVRNHMTRILQKLGVRNRIQAVNLFCKRCAVGCLGAAVPRCAPDSQRFASHVIE